MAQTLIMNLTPPPRWRLRVDCGAQYREFLIEGQREMDRALEVLREDTSVGWSVRPCPASGAAPEAT